MRALSTPPHCDLFLSLPFLSFLPLLPSFSFGYIYALCAGACFFVFRLFVPLYLPDFAPPQLFLIITGGPYAQLSIFLRVQLKKQLVSNLMLHF